MYRLMYVQINFIRENADAKEIPSQDLVYVSNAKLKIELKLTYFVINYSNLFYLHPTHHFPPFFSPD